MSIFRVRLVAPGILCAVGMCLGCQRVGSSAGDASELRALAVEVASRSTELTALRTELRAKRERLEGEIASMLQEEQRLAEAMQGVQPDESTKRDAMSARQRWMEHRALMKRRIAEIGPEIRSLKAEEAKCSLDEQALRQEAEAGLAKLSAAPRAPTARETEQAPSGRVPVK